MTENKIEIKRHIGKAISYRFLGTLQTIIISYIFTGNFVISSSIGIVELCVKPVIYFLHERAWYKWIKFGVTTEKPKKKVKKEVIEKSLGDFDSTLLTGLPEKTQDKIKRLNYSSKR
jgi:uncharacterized membrane protein